MMEYWSVEKESQPAVLVSFLNHSFSTPFLQYSMPFIRGFLASIPPDADSNRFAILNTADRICAQNG